MYDPARLLLVFVAFQTVQIFCHITKELDEILQLRAEPDFKLVKLYWEYAKNGPNFNGFQIHYCELQAWGPNKCRTKIIDESSGMESSSGKKFRTHSVVINSLRMSTNYSFEVRPVKTYHNSHYTKNLGKNIIVPTKGFSVKAKHCLLDESEVEIATGPNFGGRISVESSNGSKVDASCSIGGDANSTKDTYELKIKHKVCGSVLNRTTVSTYIIVQETLPILTHSARRFVVQCTFQPQTLTVRAGIDLPYSGMSRSFDSGVNSRSRYDFSTNEIANNQPAFLKQVGDKLNNGDDVTNHTIYESHFLVKSSLLLLTLIGIVLSIWWTIPLRKKFSFNIAGSRNPSPSSCSNDCSCFTAFQ